MNVVMTHFDLMLHVNKYDTLIEFFVELNTLLCQNRVPTDKKHRIQHLNESSQLNSSSNKQVSYLIPLIKAKEMPLLNIDIHKARIILPCYNADASKITDLIIAQMISLNLTSQVENPLMRNFLNNSASHAIYNKAKSSGTLYKPGFEFEDRQYALEVKDLALFRTQAFCLANEVPGVKAYKTCIPILDNFDLRAVLGLPILFGKRLINGYTLEISIPTSNLLFYFGNLEVNLLLNTLNQNLNALSQYKTKFSHVSSTANVSSVSSDSQKDRLESDLKIIPLDVLLTAENINVYFYTVDSATVLKKANSLFWMQFIQPHTCLIMHQSLQKFEISVFDFSLKRSTPSSFAINSNSLITFEEDDYILPQNSDFLMPVVETKPGEPNSKTGVLNGVFSLKLHNFASLFCYENSNSDKFNESSSDCKSSENLICVCNECLRCYEFKSNKISGQKLYQNGKITFQITDGPKKIVTLLKNVF